MPARSGRIRGVLGSVRFRITLAALVVVAFTLALGGAALVWQVHRTLVGNLTTTASTEASNVTSLIATGPIPTSIVATRPGYAVQVVDASGHVLASSPELAGRPAVADQRPSLGQSVTTKANLTLPGDDDPDIVVAQSVAGAQGIRTVYVLASDEQEEDSVHDVAFVLALILPVLVLLAGVFAWILAGRALRPVEEIRAEVAEISGGDLHRRVPEPHINDEVGRLARTMNAMLGRIEATNDRQRQFISNASHELRSPLAAMLAQMEVARDHPQVADWPKVADAVIADGTRLHRLVDDLLVLARSDEGQLVAGKDTVDMDELVLEEGRRLRSQGKISVDLRGVGAGRVIGDRDQLRRVVRNLAENAGRHAAGAVNFSLAQTGRWVELDVSDDGPGIPPERRTQVFERFVRLDEARNRTDGGTGLGLAIVGDVVQAHGGSVQVADSPKGTRMVVKLPAAGEGETNAHQT